MCQIFHGYDISAGVVYQDANIVVTAAENTHFNFQPGTPPYGKYKSFSYRVETPERTFLFTGDTGPSEAVTALGKGADVLVTEVTSIEDVIDVFKRTGAWQAKTEDEQKGWIRHMEEEHVSPKDVGEKARKADVKTVVMTHLGPSVATLIAMIVSPCLSYFVQGFLGDSFQTVHAVLPWIFHVPCHMTPLGVLLSAVPSES